MEDARMKTTIGQLVSSLYSRYQREYRDDALAALATEVVVGELLRGWPLREVARRTRRAA
jgi:hypothetical protein